MTPLFDSLTHPSLTGEFSGKDCSFKTLASELKKNGIRRACAVGIPGIGQYTHERYWDECQKYPVFLPVAGLDSQVKSIRKEIQKIRSLGYRALKIHPRLSGWDLTKPLFSEAISICAEEGLTVFFCTYYSGNVKGMPSTDPFWSLVTALKKSPKVKMVLVHGGCVEVLRYAELTRANANLLLDLSFTMMKYEGSSLDADIRFLMERFDRRICVGSDAPDFTPRDFAKRFSKISHGLSPEKQKNIAYSNLSSFLGVS